MNDPHAKPNKADQNSQSRRDFLAATMAAAAATTVLGSCSGSGSTSRVISGDINRSLPTSQPRVPVGEGETIRMAIIGTGGMGSGHMGAIMGFAKRKEENVQIVALCDVNQVRLAAAHARCEKEQGITVDTYGNYHDVLARKDIHGVLVASPEHWHAQMAVDALAAGKDLYLEKPMCLRLPEALWLRRMVLANPQLIFQVGTQKMILPKWLKAREVIASGGIGKPTFSQTSYCRNSKDGEWLYYAIDPKVIPGKTLDWDGWLGHLGPRDWDPALYARWRRYKDFSTGIVGDLLVHEMTPLMMALDMGWPTRVSASGGHYVDKVMENHDQVNLTVEFEGEHTMIVAGSTCNDIGLEVMVRGHEASIWMNSNDVLIRPQRHWVDEIDEQTIQCGNIGNDQDQLRKNWLGCIRTRKPAVSGVDLATKMMVAVDLATRSMWEGHAFAFDPKTMTASIA
ncbi:MAG: Gfo/Idh/MocA family oxidoreductase [Planctomycetes bacterium]|nr:Gfo/Idh/MocA family oxidoreductase [Planctomycetota bacterium]